MSSTTPHRDQRVLVWGQAPEVYWASDRRPATRFATTGFLTGATGGRPSSRVGPRYAVPGAADDFFSDLQRTPPALIADMSTADQRHAHYYPPRRFPRFQHFLDRGAWHQVAVVDGVAILRPGPRTASPATVIRFDESTIPSMQRTALGRILCVVALLAFVAFGCAASESSRIGACPIRPGAACSGNYMTGAHLAGAGLYDADFEHADLTGVDLDGADLSGATMAKARLNRAHLRSATLSYADLSQANLTGADLTDADLTATTLTGAEVTPQQLGRAKLCRTTLPDGSIAAPGC